jgi:hypothetical protein
VHDRKNRGLRMSDEAHAQLRDLKEASGVDMYTILETALAAEYRRHRNDPKIGPVLAKLEELRDLKRTHAARPEHAG